MEDLSRQQDQKRSRVCSSSEEICRKDSDMEQSTSTAPSGEQVGTNNSAPSSDQVSTNSIQQAPSSEQVSTNSRLQCAI